MRKKLKPFWKGPDTRWMLQLDNESMEVRLLVGKECLQEMAVRYIQCTSYSWGTPEALYCRRFLHGVHLPANQRRLPPLPTDPIGWDVYAM